MNLIRPGLQTVIANNSPHGLVYWQPWLKTVGMANYRRPPGWFNWECTRLLTCIFSVIWLVEPADLSPCCHLRLFHGLMLHKVLTSLHFSSMKTMSLLRSRSKQLEMTKMAKCYTWLSSLLVHSILIVLICCNSRLRYMLSSCIFSFNWFIAIWSITDTTQPN